MSDAGYVAGLPIKEFPYKNWLTEFATFADDDLVVYVSMPCSDHGRTVSIESRTMVSFGEGEQVQQQIKKEFALRLTEEAARRLHKQLEWAINYQEGDPVPEF